MRYNNYLKKNNTPLLYIKIVDYSKYNAIDSLS